MNAFITQLGIYMRDYSVQNPAVQMTLMAWSSIAPYAGVTTRLMCCSHIESC